MSPSNETTVRRTKIGIVGAGSVGTSLAYAAMIRGTSTDIALYDLQTAKVQAEALDLSHGQMFTPGSGWRARTTSPCSRTRTSCS